MSESLTPFSDEELIAELERRKAICLWCGEPAQFYCDEWIGGGVRDGFFVLDAKQFTCDAPMCAEHGRKVGHICFRDGNSDTMDRCPYHVEGRESHNPETMPKTEWECDVVRRNVMAEAMRSRMKSV